MFTASRVTVLKSLVLVSCIIPVLALETLPHPNCQLMVAPFTSVLCKPLTGTFRYMFPTNFNVSLLSLRSTALYVQKAVVESHHVPFPPRNELLQIDFNTFNLGNFDIRFPLNSLLVNVKHSIRTLYLVKVKLKFLVAEDFNGFAVLENLRLHTCYLASISSSVFQELGHLGVGQLSAPRYEPKVLRIEIKNTPGLQCLDWSFLQPISRSIEVLHIRSSQLGMTKLICSAPFTLKKLTYIILDDNQLQTMPETFFKLLNTTLQLDLKLAQNSFCSETSDCSCCEIFPFVTWITQHDQFNALRDFRCGYSALAVLSHNISFEHCGAGTVSPRRTSVPDSWPAPLNGQSCENEATSTVSYGTHETTTNLGGNYLELVSGITVGVACALVVLLLILLALHRRGNVQLMISCIQRLFNPATGNHNQAQKAATFKLETIVPSVFILPKWRIVIEHDKVLGSGFFSKVFLGNVLPPNDSETYKFNKTAHQLVAVKTRRGTKTDQFREEFYAEAAILIRIGSHPNIVTCMGVYYQGLDYMGIVLEYCLHGSLHQFLKKAKAAAGLDGSTAKFARFPEEQSLTFCYQIGCGMSYISDMGIIHRDLAGRNILLDHTMTAKIGDFGMAREDQKYVLERNQVPLPIRWMAPESISCMTFTTKSDVWSFAVVIWEIYTLGATPYAESGFQITPENLYNKLKEDYRLILPASTHPIISDILRSCWEWKPEDRHSFSEIITTKFAHILRL